MRYIILLVVITSSLSSKAMEQYHARMFDQKLYCINNVELYISNYGTIGNTSSGAGCWWPKGSQENYIYGAGIWIGALDIHHADTAVTIGYGPHGGESEFAPGLTYQDPLADYTKIYISPDPWPAPLEFFPDAPQAIFSDQDAWCCYNDLDMNYHMPGDTRPLGVEVSQTIYGWNLLPLSDAIFIKYEIKNVTADTLEHCYVGFCTDNDIGDESGGGNDLVKCIIGQWYVIDGESLWIDDLAFQWQYETEPGWDVHPGVIGTDFLQSAYELIPGADKDSDGIFDQFETDSVWYCNNLPDSKWDVDQDNTPDWRDPSEIPQRGMSAFKRFTLNLEPNKDNERYQTLAGYNYKVGTYEPYDTIPFFPDDQRSLQASGPFDLPPDSTVTFMSAIMFAQWDSIHPSPDTEIVKVDYVVQHCYDMNWLLPKPPPPPSLTCIPGDAKITLTWGNISEITPDPYYQVAHFANPNSPGYDPYYQEYDFQGYRLWKSLTGRRGTWELLGAFDRPDGVIFTDTTVEDSIAIKATDNGVIHTYIDQDVRNGFNYSYAITAFDYNYIKQPADTFRAMWLESGPAIHNAVPRRDPADYVAVSSPVISMESGNACLLDFTTASAVLAFDVDETKAVFISYSKPETTSIPSIFKDTLGNTFTVLKDGLKFTVYLLNSEKVAVDSIDVTRKLGIGYTYHEFPAENGICIRVPLGTGIFSGIVDLVDSVTVTGTYPESLISHVALSKAPSYHDTITADTLYDRGFWAYRGNDYEIRWLKKYGSDSVNSVVVIDAESRDTIPFKPFKNSGATRHLADGWCFTFHNSFILPWVQDPSDTVIPAGSRRSRFLYINGTMIGLNTGNLAMTRRPSSIDVWMIHASKNYAPTTVNALMKVSGEPGRFLDAAVRLNVKVVPNPYITHNEWEQSRLTRRIKFINLPSKCTIRIFTINGELVRTIQHLATVTPGKEPVVENNAGGDEWWNLLNEYSQLVASGVYLFHVQSAVGEQVGKFVLLTAK